MISESRAAGIDIVLLFNKEGLRAIVIANAPFRIQAPILIAIDC